MPKKFYALWRSVFLAIKTIEYQVFMPFMRGGNCFGGGKVAAPDYV